MRAVPVVLSLLLAAGAVGGCGEEGASGPRANEAEAGPPNASNPSVSTPSGSLSSAPPLSAAPASRLVGIVTVTAAGGKVGDSAVLSDPAVTSPFVAEFSGDVMSQRLGELTTTSVVPQGSVLYAAVVAIGCDSPTDVTITDGAKGLAVSAVEVAAPQQECFAPMTSVAVLTVPADSVP